MHTQPLQRPGAIVGGPPQLATAPCPTCGPLPMGAPHTQNCFLAFQRALLSAYPALTGVVTMEEAGAIERTFRFWTGIIHALRSSPVLVADCVERRWHETTAYVERMLARHARTNTAAS